MGKKKKKGMPDRRPIQSHLAITKNYFDDFNKTAHKFMRLIGLEPSDYDVLTKRTKQGLMRFKNTPYKIYADKGSRVPGAYVNFFNAVILRFEKQTFYGDPQYGISYYEYVTYGLTFIFSIRNYDGETGILPDQYHLLEKIKQPLVKYTTANQDDHYAVRTITFLNFLFSCFSQPNYRFYTGKEELAVDYCKARFKNKIHISSIEPERKNFVIDRDVRPSYRLGIYKTEMSIRFIKPTMVELPMALLEPENSKSLISQMVGTQLTLPVYIQNHALHRFAQRLDCFDNYLRNKVLAFSFMEPSVITATNGQRLIVAKDFRGKNIGYFPFVQQDGAVLLLSFLPLASPITPEGSVLQKELGIQFNDSKFIGLDKLSYYVKTDFDTIPQLKKALKKANMWHLTDYNIAEKVERKEDRIIMNYLSRINAMEDVLCGETVL
jgi:hypothetical protein